MRQNSNKLPHHWQLQKFPFGRDELSMAFLVWGRMLENLMIFFRKTDNLRCLAYDERLHVDWLNRCLYIPWYRPHGQLNESFNQCITSAIADKNWWYLQMLATDGCLMCQLLSYPYCGCIHVHNRIRSQWQPGGRINLLSHHLIIRNIVSQDNLKWAFLCSCELHLQLEDYSTGRRSYWVKQIGKIICNRFLKNLWLWLMSILQKLLGFCFASVSRNVISFLQMF